MKLTAATAPRRSAKSPWSASSAASGSWPPLYAEHGGVYLAAGRNFETFEGDRDFKSFMISKWPSMAAVKGFWTSPEYDALRRARLEGNWGRFNVFALEGLPDAACAAK